MTTKFWTNCCWNWSPSSFVYYKNFFIYKLLFFQSPVTVIRRRLANFYLSDICFVDAFMAVKMFTLGLLEVFFTYLWWNQTNRFENGGWLQTKQQCLCFCLFLTLNAFFPGMGFLGDGWMATVPKHSQWKSRVQILSINPIISWPASRHYNLRNLYLVKIQIVYLTLVGRRLFGKTTSKC